MTSLYPFGNGSLQERPGPATRERWNRQDRAPLRRIRTRSPFPASARVRATPSVLQSSQRKGWLLARSEVPAAAHRAINALAPAEDMGRRITAGVSWLQARPGGILPAYGVRTRFCWPQKAGRRQSGRHVQVRANSGFIGGDCGAGSAGAVARVRAGCRERKGRGPRLGTA